nr:RNA-directed DNA polymerase [Paenalkalicoccus suaedae]
MPKAGLYIIRTDIKNFFPSINKHVLYRKLTKSSLLSKQSLDTLKPMFFSSKVDGIPLGLPFSSALSEIYLEHFDEDLQSTINPLYYFRYVDDIILINYIPHDGLDLNNEINKIIDVFKKHFLEPNLSKTEFILYEPKTNDKYFSYLGYQFNFENNQLRISIASSKFKKVTDRIKNYCFLYRNSNKTKKDYWKLYYRLKNTLYGIRSYNKNKKIMNFGVGYTYKYVNDYEQINEIIDVTQAQILTCNLKNKERKLLINLVKPSSQENSLLKKRYDYTKLTPNQMNKIKMNLNITKNTTELKDIFSVIYKNIHKFK